MQGVLKKCKVIAVASQKGGTAKSTTCRNLATVLKNMKYKVMEMEVKKSVYKKMQDELDSRLDKIAKLQPEEIIEKAYEITIKEELVMLFQHTELDE
ncbi:DUF3848 domain-containing protein [Vallitalea pronyensis]|uniref:DUF3848 domain-containing protein n=1 Tax=Vallitalea pronyensis TaxID=1348613 RepID=A0A8J8SG89_9FIRM|nr:DUF3848 domain-containing protein [Vallitalea pronyensis]QUI22063.1 DUF3848 domain-containing protein [Vallitalea pronyensis]